MLYAYQLALLKVPVTNLQRSVTFYRDELGFEPQFVVEEFGWAQLVAQELPLALYVPGQGGGSSRVGGSTGFHLLLSPTAFDSLATSLQRKGMLVTGQVQTGADDTRFIEVSDPDGNVIKIMRMPA
jgi:catechol 2,3-dioxygenase-like lactoylglutathione lyase family enzyme